jgi:hypothetical protein
VTECTFGIISKTTSAVLCLSVFVGVAASCDQGSRVPDGDGEFDLRVCSDNWSTVYSPEQQPISLIPNVLGWHQGHLYAVVHERPGSSLISVPDVGGERLTLIQGLAGDRALWFEGKNLLFLSLGEPVSLPDGSRGAPTLLESMPATGGPAEVLTTVREASAPYAYIFAWAVDAESVYWVEIESAGDKSTVWASPRVGGGARILATLDGGGEFTLFDGIQLVGYDVFVYPTGPGYDVPVFSIPKAGGEARRLPTAWHSARLIGVAKDGTVLVARNKSPGNGEPRSETFEMGRLRPGADAVEPFWSGLPPTAYAIRAWNDGAGGFYLHTWEWGPNDAFHATMWSLDAKGQSQRLGCDPVVGSTIFTAAVGPDGIYGILIPGHTFEYWSIVKISR